MIIIASVVSTVGWALERNGWACALPVPTLATPLHSSWLRTALSIKNVTESQVTVVYLDFVRDVEQMTELLNNNSVKAIKYTGKMGQCPGQAFTMIC